jgi:ferritin-like metal-binding protein YciE
VESYTFQNLYVEQINDLHGAESLIVATLPEWLEVTSSEELREEFSFYLQEIKNHIEQLDKILSDLKLSAFPVKNSTIEGILGQGQIAAHHGGNSSVKDASLIAIVQRLAHYKMAIYGTARTFARHLDFNRSMDILQRCLNEEGEVDRKLTRIAEGGVFTTGINEQACKAKAYI